MQAGCSWREPRSWGSWGASRFGVFWVRILSWWEWRTMLGVEKPFRSGVYKLYRAFLLQVGVDLDDRNDSQPVRGPALRTLRCGPRATPGSRPSPHVGRGRFRVPVICAPEEGSFRETVRVERPHSRSSHFRLPASSARVAVLRAETIDLVDAASIRRCVRRTVERGDPWSAAAQDMPRLGEFALAFHRRFRRIPGAVSHAAQGRHNPGICCAAPRRLACHPVESDEGGGRGSPR